MEFYSLKKSREKLRRIIFCESSGGIYRVTELECEFWDEKQSEWCNSFVFSYKAKLRNSKR